MSIFFGILYCVGLILPLLVGLALKNYWVVLMAGVVFLISSVLIYIFGGGKKNTAKAPGLEAIFVVIPFGVGAIYLIISGVVWWFFGRLHV